MTLHVTATVNVTESPHVTVHCRVPGTATVTVSRAGKDDTVAYHGKNKGAATVVLVPGQLFSVFGPQTGVDGPIPPVIKRELLGELTSSQGAQGGVADASIADASRKGLRELQATTPGAGTGVTKRVFPGATVTQDEQFFNVSVNGYNIPTNYTTYACNVSETSTSLRPLFLL